ncbi:MAG TPA: VWA domain-containing protein [Chloroflexota bacterium]|nr:VWA domain-containing protein [Chloroflexota bacterium]
MRFNNSERLISGSMNVPSLTLPFDISFLQPQHLLLLLLVPFLWRIAGARLRSVPSGQRRAALAIRSLVLALLVTALAEPILNLHRSSLELVFAVDTSSSVSPEQRTWFQQWIDEAAHYLRPDDRVASIAFDHAASLGQTAAPEQSADQDRTNIESALRTASALLPEAGSRHIVMMSDGWETEGNVQQSDALTDGIAIHHVVPPQPDSVDASIRSIEVPSHTRIGEPLDAAVTIDSLVDTSATLRVWFDERLVAEEETPLTVGANQVGISPMLRSEGFHTVRAEISAPGDSHAENNSAAATTVTRGAGHVLVIEERSGEGSEVANVLAESGVTVDVQPAVSIPTNIDPLRQFDSIVLANVPSTSLALDQLRTLQIFVQDLGRGLMVTGGQRAFAPGGYEGTILNEMLPVNSSPPTRRRQGSVALVLVIDKSGSMDLFRTDVSKIAMAREAAIQATQLLQVDDTLGVIGFDSRFSWVVPMTRLHTPDDLKQAQAKISQIQADGGTTIFPALEAAYEAIAPVDARLKHIVLLTDGQSFNADYAGLIQRMRPRDITLSTVAVGSDSDTKLLTMLANIGEGRYYFTERSTEIPKIASKEANILTRNAMVEGDVSVLNGEPSPIMRGISADLPTLQGYIGTTPRPRAVTALGTDRGDPLLAHWQYGLGRVVAWTSDTEGHWSNAWLDSSEARRVWSQAVRWSMPEPQRPELKVSALVDGPWVTLRAESVRDDGTFADLQDTRATVVTPGGEAVEARLPQRAPGIYELRTEAPGPGVYRVLFAQYENGKSVRDEMSGFVVLPNPETRGLGVNHALLDQLAARTGGRALTDPADIQSLERTDIDRQEPLWHWLAALALLLLPLDVAIRRLRWPWFSRAR